MNPALGRLEEPNESFIQSSRALTPNPSLKLTRYGRHCKPGLRYSVHCLSPGLQSLPTRAA
jgi:hypothetical protein